MKQALLALLLAAGCKGPPSTEIILVVRSDLPPDQLRSVRLTAASFRSGCTLVGAGHTELPLTFGLEPGGHPERAFTVDVQGFADEGCTQFSAEQSATLGFVPGHRQVLTLELLQACAGLMCPDPHTTCYDASRACKDNTAGVLPDYGADASTSPADGAQPAPDGADAGAPSLCPGSFPFCDGFESGNFNAWTEYDPSPSTYQIDDARYYRGAHAAHLHLDGSTAGFPSAGIATNIGATPLYLRSFLFIPSGYSSTDLVKLLRPDVSAIALRLDMNTLEVGTSGFASPPFQTVTSTVAPRRNAWICVELMFDDAAHELRVWLDGAEIPSLHVTGIAASGFTQAAIAIDGNNPGPNIDLWADEVAMDGMPIGCDR